MDSRSTTLNMPAPSQQLARHAPSRAKFRPFVFMSAVALFFTVGGGLTIAFLGASESGADIARHAEQGGVPVMLDAFGNALDYRHVPSRGAKASRITVRLTPSCCARVPSVSSFAPGCSEPSPAQGATGLFNPANSSTTANAPTSGGLPANAMTSAQLMSVRVRTSIQM